MSQDVQGNEIKVYRKPPAVNEVHKKIITSNLAYLIIGAFLTWNFLLFFYLLFASLEDKFSLESVIQLGKDVFTFPVGAVLGYYFSKKE